MRKKDGRMIQIVQCQQRKKNGKYVGTPAGVEDKRCEHKLDVRIVYIQIVKPH
ncbi:hypothetical protein IQC45_21805 [Leptospira interrogans serovar Pomona]|nr:hypothetical protein [Leptospira interrogans serovar Pomona]